MDGQIGTTSGSQASCLIRQAGCQPATHSTSKMIVKEDTLEACPPVL